MGYLENFKLKLNNGCSIWKEDQKKKKKANLFIVTI